MGSFKIHTEANIGAKGDQIGEGEAQHVACREDMRNVYCTQSLSGNLMKRDRLGDLGLHRRQGLVCVKLLKDKTQVQDTSL